MKKTIKFINEFYFYDNNLKKTITFPQNMIIDEDNPYFKEIYNRSKDYYIEIKVEEHKKEEVKIEVKEEIKEELQEEVKSNKKKKNRFFKNEE